MPTLNLKPTHKPVKSYYAALDQFAKRGVTHETAVRAAFQGLLEHCKWQSKWTRFFSSEPPEYTSVLLSLPSRQDLPDGVWQI